MRMIDQGPMLGQAPPGTREIEIAQTWELVPGDMLRITFPIGSRGWLTYGGSELFRVTSVDPASGAVSVVDEGGSAATFAGGDKEELLRRLAEKTSFAEVRLYRSRQWTPIQPALLEFAIANLQDPDARAEAEEMYTGCVDPDLPAEEQQG